MKLVSVAEMLTIEKAADAAGASYEQMMENAGGGLADIIMDAYSHVKVKSILGLVGKGNNGGDAMIALTVLAVNGWDTTAFVVDNRKQADVLFERLNEAGATIILAERDKQNKKLRSLVLNHAFLLDGLLGTGIRLPLRAPYDKVLKSINRYLNGMETPPILISVDCPSGVDCNSGETAAECLHADLTVCMAAVKMGMLQLPAFAYVGELRQVDIGLPKTLKPWKAVKRFAVDAEMVRKVLPPRPLDAHKGTFGTVMVVAGSVNYTGAALLAGEAAYRIGTGLVTMAVPTPLYTPLAGQLPEATWLILPDSAGVIDVGAANIVLNNLTRVTALLIGPGIGLEDTTKGFLSALLSSKPASVEGKMGLIGRDNATKNNVEAPLPPMVVDADGLKLLSEIEDWYKLLPSPAVLSPHPGEMAALTGESKDAIQANRVEMAERYAKKWGHVIVLKGAFTVIAAPNGQTAMIPVASPALARAGSGDVLAGMIVGLMAQGIDAYPAAYAAAWLHGQAGLSIATKLGTTTSVLAGDLLEEIAVVFARLN